ncbi:DUF1273 domain-containing protein [Paenibacillus sp. UNC499MF]|uniref:DUF1273 domain-containing protein n=1 Tax=unclassified Paenibacillus TaxID=185978 RepID=UPI00089FE03A|nr:DUF1273 domain-containing protein [Paenibacillus sp. UNC499MF]SEG64278.1 Uncharacterized SPBc2 prophage-derived protein YoqJ [Paenibacillus sp. UNC499MF]
MKNLLVTGYRAHELNIFNEKHEGIEYIKKAIAGRLIPLIEDGLEWVITPGQYGVDLWACEVVIELKKQYPQLKLSILTAYANPEEKWKEDKQEFYRGILKDVDFYGAVSKQPYAGVWQLQARDDLLLRKTDGLLLFYDEEAGEGSPRFMKERALKKQNEDGYAVMIITPEEVQDIADEENRADFY